jgi:Protein of unknown function (DUF2934)
MASKSTLDPENFPAGRRRNGKRTARDIGALGPSDSSDSGSDLSGARPNTDDMSLDRGADEDSDAGHTNDIDVDRVVSAGEAGLGGGLDQAEEAQLGVRDGDESRAASDRRRRIAEAAYHRAEQRGFAPGYEDEDWLAAERDIDAGR